jgi:hypothetical protein
VLTKYIDEDSYNNVTSADLWRQYIEGYCNLLQPDDAETYDIMNELVARGFEPCEDASLRKTVFRYVDAESYGNVTSHELWSQYLAGYCDLLPDGCETYDVMLSQRYC